MRISRFAGEVVVRVSSAAEAHRKGARRDQVALTIEHPRGCRWDVNRDGDLVGVVIGKYDIGFLVMDREGSFIGNYCSLTKAFLAVARDDEVRTLETIWSLS